MTAAWYLKLGLLVSWLVGLSVSERLTCDQDDDRSRQQCRFVLPNCLEYEYVPDNQNPGRYIFRCLTCTEGMVPYWSFNNITLARYYQDQKVPSDAISMCAPNSEGKPVKCTSKNCFNRIFPFCNSFVVVNPEYIQTNVTRGFFRCVQCEEHFEPLPSAIFAEHYEPKDYNSRGTRLCTRKQGVFPCGTYCQAEFPGCARIQISKVQGGSSSSREETANFRCIEAVPGYILLDQQVQGSTVPFKEPKFTTLPAYTSDLKRCESRQCSNILPNCELYFKEHKDNIYETYYCKKCKATMEPRPDGDESMTEILAHLFLGRPLMVCDQPALDHAACDEQCKLEFPGCDVVSVKIVEHDYDSTNATYTCNKCAEGFVAVSNNSVIPSWVAGPAEKNVKVLCIPKEALQPTPVRGDMTALLPKCLQYTSRLVSNSSRRVFEYTCVQCEQGWEPVGPAQADWFSQAERFVCRHAPLNNPVDCNDDCKQNFPNCDRLMISRTDNGSAVYQCLECSNGFYPIPYERENYGRLVATNPIASSSKIYLCSDMPEERYLGVVSCAGPSIYTEQWLQCATDDNCELVASTRRLSNTVDLWKCLECKPGYRIKSPRDSFFLSSPVFCEKAVSSSEVAPSRPI